LLPLNLHPEHDIASGETYTTFISCGQILEELKRSQVKGEIRVILEGESNGTASCRSGITAGALRSKLNLPNVMGVAL